MRRIIFYPEIETDLHIKCFPFEGLALGDFVSNKNSGHLLPNNSFYPILHPRLGLNSWEDLKAAIKDVPGKIKDEEGTILYTEFFFKTIDCILNLPNKEITQEIEEEFHKDIIEAHEEFREYFKVLMEFDLGFIKQLIAENKEVLGFEPK